MTPRQLLLRCMAFQRNGQWIACCLDLDLVAQDDSFEAARARLDEQIRSYILDAVVGEDREYADQLLLRRAPFRMWVMYGWIAAAELVRSLFHNANVRSERQFKEPMPLIPAA